MLRERQKKTGDIKTSQKTERHREKHKIQYHKIPRGTKQVERVPKTVQGKGNILPPEDTHK